MLPQPPGPSGDMETPLLVLIFHIAATLAAQAVEHLSENILQVALMHHIARVAADKLRVANIEGSSKAVCRLLRGSTVAAA